MRTTLILGLLIAHAGLVLHCAADDFVTYDEVGNLAAGLAYLGAQEFDLFNVNPPLVKQLAALPVYLAGPDLSAIRFVGVPGARPEWDIGDRFARSNGARYLTFVRLGRLAGLGWSILGALLVLRWASILGGPRGGLAALAAWCFEPNVIAHAHLITCDLPAAVAALAAAYTFRSYLLTCSWWTALVAGVALGVAELCKLTLLVLYPVWLVLWLIWGRSSPAGATAPGWPLRTAHLLLLFAVSILVLNTDYAWQNVGQQLQDISFVSQTLGGPTETGEPIPTGQYGNRFRGSTLGTLFVLLPEAYVRGIDLQRRDFEIRFRQTYLGGEWRQGGWWYYYLYAAGVKVPLGVWALFGLGMITAGAKRWHWPEWREVLLLGLPGLAILVLVSSQSTVQSHFRYVLPAHPFAIVCIGMVGPLLQGRLAGKVLVGLLLASAALSYLRVHPHSLAYFNEVAGGLEGGADHLLGSNIDWGQDLLRLERWLAEHPEARPLHLAYFNHIDPRVAGIEFDLPPLGVTGPPPKDPRAAAQLGPHPGYHAVSVRYIRGTEGAPPDGRGGHGKVPRGGYGYFRRFEPLTRVGGGLLIYHITPQQADTVRAELGLAPLASPRAVERPGGASPRVEKTSP